MPTYVPNARLPLATATRYVVPLREGGSLPAIVEADDEGTYVVKFHGAGQGPRVLAAEVIAAKLASALGIAVPDAVVIDLPQPIAKYEADEEAQDLLNASIGLNLGSDFLPGATAFEATSPIDPQLAARILFLDGLLLNIDRSWHNPNLLVWHGALWCIDHGASLYFHHSWEQSVNPARIGALAYDFTDHVLVRRAELDDALVTEFRQALGDDVLAQACAAVPDEWLLPCAYGWRAESVRSAYVQCIAARRDNPRWVAGLLR